MITYTKGNVALAREAHIAHGCNAQGVMGSGVAKEIRRLYPDAYTAYRMAYLRTGLELGSVVVATPIDGKIIYNCITQQYYGNDDKVYASYEAIAKCFAFMNGWVAGRAALAIPRIGCGLGGLEWDKVEAIILKAARYDVVVYDI